MLVWNACHVNILLLWFPFILWIDKRKHCDKIPLYQIFITTKCSLINKEHGNICFRNAERLWEGTLLSLSYLLTFFYFVAPFLTVSLALLNGPLVRDIFPVSACAFFPISALKEPEIKSLSQAGTDPGALV